MDARTKKLLEPFAEKYWAMGPKRRAAVVENWRAAAAANRRGPLEKLRAYAEEGDPFKYLREVHSFKCHSLQVKIGQKLMSGEDRFIVVGSKNFGKSTFFAGWACWLLFPLSQLPDENGDPQGGIVVIPGPTHKAVQLSIWQRFLKHCDRAEKNGFPLTTMFKNNPKKSKPEWDLGTNHYICSVCPPPSTKHEISHGASGMHSTNYNVMIEEAAQQDERVWGTMDSGASGRGNSVYAMMNPDPGGKGAAQRRIEDGRYRCMHVSILDFVNITERKTVVPGAADHLKIEDRIRTECVDLGPLEPGKELDKKRHHFLWALPEKGEEERGPRSDGGPGMEGCEEHVFAPSPAVITSVLGQFLTGHGDCPFDMEAWDECVELGKAAGIPDGEPARWGVDPAAQGPNAAIAAPAWGPTFRDAWSAVRRFKADRPGEPLVGIEPIQVGRLIRLKDGDGDTVAADAFSHIGNAPVLVDKGAGGASCHDAMKNVWRMQVTSVDFGPKIKTVMEGETLPFNRRAQLILNLAQLVLWRVIHLPDDANLRKGAQSQRIDFEHDVVREDPTTHKMVLATKLVRKDKLPPAGQDELDATVMAVQSPEDGGFSLEVF